MDLKREIPRIMGAQTVRLCRTDLEKKNPSDIGMKTKKLRILIAQIVWQRSVGSLFPLHNLKIFFRRISCTQSVYVRSVGFYFFCYFEFV